MIRRTLAKLFRSLSKLNYGIRLRRRCFVIHLKYLSGKIGRDLKIGRNIQFNVFNGGSVSFGRWHIYQRRLSYCGEAWIAGYWEKLLHRLGYDQLLQSRN